MIYWAHVPFVVHLFTMVCRRNVIHAECQVWWWCSEPVVWVEGWCACEIANKASISSPHLSRVSYPHLWDRLLKFPAKRKPLLGTSVECQHVIIGAIVVDYIDDAALSSYFDFNVLHIICVFSAFTDIQVISKIITPPFLLPCLSLQKVLYTLILNEVT